MFQISYELFLKASWNGNLISGAVCIPALSIIIDLNSVQSSVTKGFKRCPIDLRREGHAERDTNIENNVTKVF
jgi:hypothetical protein